MHRGTISRTKQAYRQIAPFFPNNIMSSIRQRTHIHIFIKLLIPNVILK
ncbi:unnamed protein product [Acanthoscelides obtectus]|uniref:Uncharacterized protein n=1 Tax=Acanthoscelides obtectus TaxID=200917 RepID=A0A9P0LHY8_ACAOB|nr:unnamed protein product [Acanthoscelides obtectus]CAK1667853.1 hypothetical protein AOBTE_LOCUS26071 [Acanthoscelides obtectus]